MQKFCIQPLKPSTAKESESHFLYNLMRRTVKRRQVCLSSLTAVAKHANGQWNRLWGSHFHTQGDLQPFACAVGTFWLHGRFAGAGHAVVPVLHSVTLPCGMRVRIKPKPVRSRAQWRFTEVYREALDESTVLEVAFWIREGTKL